MSVARGRADQTRFVAISIAAITDPIAIAALLEEVDYATELATALRSLGANK